MGMPEVDADQRFTDDLMKALVKRSGVVPVVDGLPPGVNAQLRSDGTTETVFTMNFNDHEAAGLPAFGVNWATRPVVKPGSGPTSP